jgi:Tfp pilus assembly protein PilF
VRGCVVIAVGGLIAGCATPDRSSPYSTAAAEKRDTSGAEALNREAADLLQSNPTAAEALLREALGKDLFFGPAHNNLGIVHLHRGEFYEAASEFEWARKLLPASADPRINLAITLERAGRAGDAMDAYKSALEVQPGSIAAMQGAAVLAVRAGKSEPRLAAWFKEIAMAGENRAWREWAAERGGGRP